MTDLEFLLASERKRPAFLEERREQDGDGVDQFDTAAMPRHLPPAEMNPVPVRCNVYHVGKSEGLLSVRTANGLLKVMGSGAFHAAIQIYDMEWSFGAIDEGTGIFGCGPKACDMHDYKETVELGTVTHSREYVDRLLDELEGAWLGEDYDLLRKNCTHFSNEFAMRLGVGQIPGWTMNLATIGATLEDTACKGAELRRARDGRAGYTTSFDSYHFGDVTRGIIATGKETRGVSLADKYRFGDLTRGIAKIRVGG